MIGIEGRGAVARQVGRLFGGRSAVALGEGGLLARFAADRDEAAFEALVGRHGPMVLGTCRRMLADPRDVEDAFQATFLVLARRADSIRDPDRLGPWLHGVARRVAGRSRALAARRGAVEGPGGEGHAVAPADDPEGAELRSALDEELARLPEKYRAPLVLCYLEGLTHDEAARQLHWPVGTVRSRLAGGRDRLRARLTRRGLAPTAAAPPATLPAVALPTTLLTTTARLASATGTVPARVASLAKGALIAMMTGKLKAVAAVGLMAGVAAGGVRAIAQQAGGGPAAAKAEAAPKDRDPAGVIRAERDKLAAELDAINLRIVDMTSEHITQLRPLEAAAAEIKRRLDALERRGKAPAGEGEPAPGSDDRAKALEAANARIRRLEGELKAAKAAPAGAARAGMSGGGFGAAGFGGGGVGGLGGGGMPGMSPPGIGAAGMSGGMGSARDNGQPWVMNLQGTSMVLVIPVGRDRATLLNTETGVRETFRAPDGVTELIPVVGGVVGGQVGAVALKGPEIGRVAAFDVDEGRWYPLDLREPARDAVSPVVGPDHAIYRVGRFLYVFSSESKKWATLALKQEPPASSLRGMGPAMINGKIIWPDGDVIHIYNARTGEWTDLDTKEAEGK